MPEKVTNEMLSDHTRQLIGIREDINHVRGDDLRRERMQA